MDIKFQVCFREMKDVPNICDYCEIKPISYYNELMCLGYCKDCMDDLQEEYEKNGGD
jgi:hypothetical protein